MSWRLMAHISLTLEDQHFFHACLTFSRYPLRSAAAIHYIGLTQDAQGCHPNRHHMFHMLELAHISRHIPELREFSLLACAAQQHTPGQKGCKMPITAPTQASPKKVDEQLAAS